MIIVERLPDSTDLIKTYSDQGLMIRQVETGIIYPSAVDVDYANYHYEETDIPIGFEEEENIVIDEELSPAEALAILLGGTINDYKKTSYENA